MVSETSALPGDHCPWLHEDEGLPPTGPRSGEPDPKETIGWAKLRPVPSPFVNRELVPKSENFDVQRPARPEYGDDAGDDGNENSSHGGTVSVPVGLLNAVRAGADGGRYRLGISR